jgi:hypothetical protein
MAQKARLLAHSFAMAGEGLNRNYQAEAFGKSFVDVVGNQC